MPRPRIGQRNERVAPGSGHPVCEADTAIQPAHMRPFRLLILALGLCLFGLVLAQADLSAVGDHVGRLVWAGGLGIPAVSLLPLLVDTWSWQILFTPPRPGWGWFIDLWKVRTVGTAISKLTPLVGAAGEPIKAV